MNTESRQAALQREEVFNSLLTKTHVNHALVQAEKRHNETPTSLATVLLLEGSPEQLQAVYESETRDLAPWSLSPVRITDMDAKMVFFGEKRVQRAYMDYYSMETLTNGGDAKGVALSHLLSGTKPLLYGLVGGFGRSLVFLSDGLETGAAVLVVESLVLASVDWDKTVYELLTQPQLAAPPTTLLPPLEIIDRAAQDARLDNLTRSGSPGPHNTARVLASKPARQALLTYVHQLDARQLPLLLRQLAKLCLLLLCATHKPSARPAFDRHLARLPALVIALSVVLHDNMPDERHRLVLVRGVWLLILLAYTTQLRPVLDPALLNQPPDEGGPENAGAGWDAVLEEFHRDSNKVEGKYMDTTFLRCLRSLRELGQAAEEIEGLFLKGAWKLRLHWRGWVGTGARGEDKLNIKV